MLNEEGVISYVRNNSVSVKPNNIYFECVAHCVVAFTKTVPVCGEKCLSGVHIVFYCTLMLGNTFKVNFNFCTRADFSVHRSLFCNQSIFCSDLKQSERNHLLSLPDFLFNMPRSFCNVCPNVLTPHFKQQNISSDKMVLQSVN